MSSHGLDALTLPRLRCAVIPILAAIVFLAAAQSALATTSLTGESLTGGTGGARRSRSGRGARAGHRGGS